jgi:uncharacterized protein YjlB
MPVARDTLKPLTFFFQDDGLVPNSALPLLIYKGAVNVESGDSEEAIEGLFGANGWGDMWRNGVYHYLHYHATVHEALGVARGEARIQFGGDRGEAIHVAAGDVAILPAGTGHECLFASHDLSIVGAYPPGSIMHVCRPTPENYQAALKAIPQVGRPATDPVRGTDGPLVKLWK